MTYRLVDRETTLEAALKSQYNRLNLQTPTYEIYRERFKQLGEHGYTDRFKLYQTLVTEFSMPFVAEALVADFRQNAWLACQVFPDAHYVLQQLRLRGYQLGLITNGMSQTQRAKLHSANLVPHFVSMLALCANRELVSSDNGVWYEGSDGLRQSHRHGDCGFASEGLHTG